MASVMNYKCAPGNPIPDEVLYALAVCPPAQDVDWKSEYARAYRRMQEFQAEVERYRDCKQIQATLKQLKDRTDGNVDMQIDDNGFRVWLSHPGHHYYGGTPQAALDKAIDAAEEYVSPRQSDTPKLPL